MPGLIIWSNLITKLLMQWDAETYPKATLSTFVAELFEGFPK
jgi:hypothetical protein